MCGRDRYLERAACECEALVGRNLELPMPRLYVGLLFQVSYQRRRPYTVF